MSLLSRLRGSKGYGACRDAASPSRRPTEGRWSASSKMRACSKAGSHFDYWNSFMPFGTMKLTPAGTSVKLM